MMHWFVKIRISFTTDSSPAQPGWLRRRVARSPELRHWDENLAATERLLKSTAVRPEPPAEFPDAIKRAIRTEVRRAPVARPGSGWRWLPAPALALAVVLAAWFMIGRSPKTAPTDLRAASDTLALSQAIPRGLPDQVVAPLSDEWASLNRDLDRTAQFLLASLP